MIRKLRTYFSAEQMNVGRQSELDIAKGFAVISMVFCHVFLYWSRWDSLFLQRLLYDILGGPFAAPVFMFCMGVGIAYSRKQSPRDLFSRGCRLLLLSFLFDFFRFALPTYFYEQTQGNTSLGQAILESYSIDILQFAGIFFMLFSGVKERNIKPIGYLIAALFLSICGHLLNGISTSILAADLIASFFWRSGSYSYFPFFNWCIFPIAGYLYAGLLKSCCHKDGLYRFLLLVTSGISAFYLYLIASRGYTEDDYYGLSTVHAGLALCLTFTIVSISHLFVSKINLLKTWFCWMSRHLTPIYVAHWLIIMYAYTFLPETAFFPVPAVLVIPAGFLVVALSCLAAQVYRHMLTALPGKTRK